MLQVQVILTDGTRTTIGSHENSWLERYFPRELPPIRDYLEDTPSMHRITRYRVPNSSAASLLLIREIVMKRRLFCERTSRVGVRLRLAAFLRDNVFKRTRYPAITQEDRDCQCSYCSINLVHDFLFDNIVDSRTC